MQHHSIHSTLCVFIVCGALRSVAAVNAPSDVYFLCQSPYTTLTLFWTDNSSNETGFRIERKLDGGSWTTVASAGPGATSSVLASFDRSLSSQFRVTATNATEVSPPSAEIRVVGTGATLEVYPEVAGIRTPRLFTNGPIVFSELQDQCPADPVKGKATRVSTWFSVQVRPASGGTFLDSPTYETRPQIRNNLAQNNPNHTGGHRPYGYGNYGPTSNSPNRPLHSRHWSNFDAAEDVVVRITLLPTATMPGPINTNDLQIFPPPLALTQVTANIVDVTLPGAPDFARHYRVAVNRTQWNSLGNRGAEIIESPLFILINPLAVAPASAPPGVIKEFNGGQLAVYGSGIFLPINNYRFFGTGGGNSACRELYAPGDAYLHGGFIFNNSYALKVWGRAIYSDELFDVYLSVDPAVYDWSTNDRTPWANQDCAAGNPWGKNPPWEGKAGFYGTSSQTTTFEGFTSIGTRMGVVINGRNARLIAHKDVGYGGSTYQQSATVNAYYYGCLLHNDDDITYVHNDYLMDRCTTYNLHNGPSFQNGWGNFNVVNIPTVVQNHTVLSSDRRATAYGKNHGVFNSRLNVNGLTEHSGGTYSNFTVYGKETIVFNLRVWNEDPVTTSNTVSVLGDQVYKDINILTVPYNKNVLWADSNLPANKRGYVRFLHFDNLVIAGNRIDHLDDGNHFSYNPGVLRHTVTFFSLPAAVTAPTAVNSPIGQTLSLRSSALGRYVKVNPDLPVSFGPACANSLVPDQSFSVVDAGGGYVALLATNGYHLKADPKRYGYIYTLPDTKRGDANTTAITEDAKFIWVGLNATNFALYSKSMGLYVRAETNCGPEYPLYAASASVGALETFSVPVAAPVFAYTNLDSLMLASNWKPATNPNPPGASAVINFSSATNLAYTWDNTGGTNATLTYTITRADTSGPGGADVLFFGPAVFSGTATHLRLMMDVAKSPANIGTLRFALRQGTNLFQTSSGLNNIPGSSGIIVTYELTGLNELTLKTNGVNALTGLTWTPRYAGTALNFTNGLPLEFGFQSDGALGATATTGTRGPILDNYRVEVSAANPPAPVISHALIGGQFIFTWPTVSGWQYQVEYKTNLTQAVWQSLGAPLPATGNSLAFTNSLTTAPESYFRVRQQPQ
jgi:hypothetical protein